MKPFGEKAMARPDRSALFLLALLAATGAAQAAPFDANLPYPTEVALSQEKDGYIYRRFPGNQRLYTYDLDPAGRSACNDSCASARPPILAPANAKAMGDWSVIRRDDGTQQWAYHGKPVYSLFHDAPNKPVGDGEGGVWHILPYEK
jgi:predicted lipoprotein with Yx(FWY)xxD motif